MIGRNNRFHGRASIQRLYKGGKSVRHGSLALRFAVNPRRSTYRLGVVVSRKVSKSAVVRNRIRRRIYERVRILSSTFAEPYDLVIVAYDEQLAALPADRLAEDITKLLHKAKITSASSGPRAIVNVQE